MPQAPGWTPVLYGLAVVAAVLLGVRWMGQPPAGESAPAGASGGASVRAGGGVPGAGSGIGGAPATVSVARDEGPAVVDVAGAVRRPGVYRLRSGARVVDALRRAGGPTRAADTSALNLAARLSDGRQVLVPRRSSVGSAGAQSGADTAGGASGAGRAPVNLNTASPEQLDGLDGVGPATVQKIVDYRTAHGGFRSVDELASVSGIGPKRLAALREKVTV